RERVAGLAGMRALPGVAIADADAVERLQAAQEADAGCVRRRVEVAGQDHVSVPFVDELLDPAGGRDRLELALELELQLPRRQVVTKSSGPTGAGASISAISVVAGNPAVRGVSCWSSSRTRSDGRRLA